jgi:PRC-barrel domain
MFSVALNADAQNRRNRNNNSNVTTSSADAGHAWKASELIGASVHTPNNEEKGKIKDLMLSGDGRVEYAAVSFGGFLGMGNKLFAVPLDAIHIEWKDNKVNYATVDVSEDSIKQRQGFDEKNWPEHADRGFLTNGGANTGTHARKTTSTSTPTTTTTSNQ